MTDEKFKVPPAPAPMPLKEGVAQLDAAPKASESAVPNTKIEVPETKEESASLRGTNPYEGTIIDKWGLGPSILQPTRALVAILVILFVGVLMGTIFFGGGEQDCVQQGLRGVIRNPGVKGKVYRCGVVPKTENCIFYVMNGSLTDKKVREFYQQVSDLTGVPKYTIDLGNVEYASSVIKPGFIAEIFVPSIVHR